MSVFEGLRGLDLSGSEMLEDLDGLAGCFSLEWIRLGGCDSLRNVDRLKGKKKLREFIYDGLFGDCSPFRSSLENIDGLSEYVSLREVVLRDADRITNLDGISGCIELKELEIFSCDSLKNLSGLSGSSGVIIQ